MFSDQDSSSVVEWAQSPREKSQSHQLLETQLSYETEWDMVNAVSFKKKPCVNGEGESVNFLLVDDARCVGSKWFRSMTELHLVLTQTLLMLT